MGNTSACSDPLTFVEDSAAPAAPAIRGPRKRDVGDTATYVATVSDTGGAGIDPAAVQWTPGRGLAAARGTAATFTFRSPGTYTIRAVATDRAGNASAPGTLRVRVQRLRLVLTATDRWRFFPAYTLTEALRARKVPARATLKVRCTGAPVRANATRDCPFRARSFKATGKIRDVNLLRFFRDRRLAPGTTIELRASAPGAVARILRYRMRANKLPTLATLCLPPGGKAARC